MTAVIEQPGNHRIPMAPDDSSGLFLMEYGFAGMRMTDRRLLSPDLSEARVNYPGLSGQD